MHLFHFTSEHHAQLIVGSGVLVVTESNIGSNNRLWPPHGEHVGPDVVWLTDRDDPRRNGLESPHLRVDKHAVRVTVDVAEEDVAHWPSWARAHGINEQWYEKVGNGYAPESWWVSEHPIMFDRWVAIDGRPMGGPRNAKCPAVAAASSRSAAEGRVVASGDLEIRRAGSTRLNRSRPRNGDCRRSKRDSTRCDDVGRRLEVRSCPRRGPSSSRTSPSSGGTFGGWARGQGQ